MLRSVKISRLDAPQIVLENIQCLSTDPLDGLFHRLEQPEACITGNSSGNLTRDDVGTPEQRVSLAIALHTQGLTRPRPARSQEHLRHRRALRKLV